MEYDPKDNEVIHLLKKLKDSNGAYPPEMMAVRRQGYLRQVAEVSAGAGLAMGLRNLAKGAKGSTGLSSTAGTVVEALLVVALVVEAGAVTYFYRDKLAEYFRSVTHSPKVEEVASPPVQPSPLAEMQLTPSPVLTITVTGTDTLTLTPVGTPPTELAAATSVTDGSGGVDVLVEGTSEPGDGTGGTTVSTSDPGIPNGNNGNHYGQTPIPARTKESGNTNPTQSSDTKNKKKP